MACQRFKITGTLAGGQTGLWIVVRQVYYCSAVYTWRMSRSGTG